MAKAQITTEAISQVTDKIDFVIDRLQEMQVFRGGPVWLDTNLTSLSGALQM